MSLALGFVMPTLNLSSKKPNFSAELEPLRDYRKLFPATHNFALIGKGYYFKDYERESHYYETQCKALGHLLPILCNCAFAKVMRLSQMGLNVFSLSNLELEELEIR